MNKMISLSENQNDNTEALFEKWKKLSNKNSAICSKCKYKGEDVYDAYIVHQPAFTEKLYLVPLCKSCFAKCEESYALWRVDEKMLVEYTIK